MPNTTSSSKADEVGTPLTPEEERDLIPSISFRSQLNELERLNILSARLWAMKIAAKTAARTPSRAPATDIATDIATDFFARELHRRMFCNVWRWAGKYRATPRNLGWEALRIAEGMRSLMDDFKTWVELKTYPGHEAVVRLHHRMVAIHPWPNGNGRHSRLMADVSLAAFFPEEKPHSWGGNADLVRADKIRENYIAAVRQADEGDIKPLLDFAKS